MPHKVKLNRLVIQEAVHSSCERIEQHALDIWQDGKWYQVATATNVGYKRILRFPAQETDRIRLCALASRATPVQELVVDLGTAYALAAFSYTPQRKNVEGMMQSGKLSVSSDGTQWEDVGSFEFGNLINDPSTRTYRLKNAKNARFVKVESTVIAGKSQSLAIAGLIFLHHN